METEIIRTMSEDDIEEYIELKKDFEKAVRDSCNYNLIGTIIVTAIIHFIILILWVISMSLLIML